MYGRAIILKFFRLNLLRGNANLADVMSMFMLFAQPLFFIFVLSFYKFKEGYFYTFFKGLLIYIPVYIVYSIVFKFVNESYRPFFLYSYILFKNYLLYKILLILIFILLFRNVFSARNSEELIFTFLAFSAGFYFGASCVDFIVNFNIHDYFTLFFLPLYRISITAVFAVIMVLVVDSYGLHRAAYTGSLLLAVLLAALGDFFYRINYYNVMLIFAIFFFSASVALFIILCRRVLPDSA